MTGYQWYWGYEYLDEDVAFESYMIGAGEGNLNEEIVAELKEAGYSADEFRLATDTAGGGAGGRDRGDGRDRRRRDPFLDRCPPSA